MNEDQLRSLINAIDLGSLSAAARASCLTVPSLAHRIETLEKEAGCTLLARSAQGVKATPAGKCLYDAALEAVNVLERGKRNALTVAQEASGPRAISLGVWWQAPDYVLKAIRNIADDGSIEVTFVETDNLRAPDGLAHGAFDVYHTWRSKRLDGLGLEFLPVTREPFVCVCSPDSPLASYPSVELERLRDVRVYAGASYQDIVGFEKATPWFELSNVVQHPVFIHQLIFECQQGSAISVFTQAAASKVCPPLVSKPLNAPNVQFGFYVGKNCDRHLARRLAEECRSALADTAEKSPL